MSMQNQRKIAAETMKCGIHRVKMLDDKQVSEALTRNDIRGLIEKGVIVKIPKHGASRAKSRKLASQKAKGRRSGPGTRHGTRNTRLPPKGAWIVKIRSLRKLLLELREGQQVGAEDYRRVYMMAKGGIFRNKKHMLSYLGERDMLISRKDAKLKTQAGNEKVKVKAKGK